MVVYYCKEAHLEDYGYDNEKKKAVLKEKYKPIRKFQIEKQIEVHGEEDFG